MHSEHGSCGSVPLLPRVLDGVVLSLSSAERRSVRVVLHESLSAAGSGVGVALIGAEWSSSQPNDVMTMDEWRDGQHHDAQRFAGQLTISFGTNYGSRGVSYRTDSLSHEACSGMLLCRCCVALCQCCASVLCCARVVCPLFCVSAPWTPSSLPPVCRLNSHCCRASAAAV